MYIYVYVFNVKNLPKGNKNLIFDNRKIYNHSVNIKISITESKIKNNTNVNQCLIFVDASMLHRYRFNRSFLAELYVLPVFYERSNMYKYVVVAIKNSSSNFHL